MKGKRGNRMSGKMKKIGVLAAAILLAWGNGFPVRSAPERANLITTTGTTTLQVWWILPEAPLDPTSERMTPVDDTGSSTSLDAWNEFSMRLNTADVASGAVGAVTGGTLYTELHLEENGNYIRQADTTGANLATLETELKKRDIVNVTSSTFQINTASSRDANNILNTVYTVSTKAASFMEGDTGLVTGGGLYNEIHVSDGIAIRASNTVAQNLIDLDAQVKTNTEKVEHNTEAIKNLKNMSNLTKKGEAVVKNLAQGVVTMKGDGVSIDVKAVKNEETDNLIYQVTAVDALVKDGNTGILTADNAYTEFRADGKYIRADKTVGINLGILDTQIKTNADNILDLENRIGNKLDVIAGQINPVAAGTAALAALQPEAYDPNDKWSFAVGYGHYRNENATAMGIFFKPEAMATFSVGSTVWSGDSMLRVGASFKAGCADQAAKEQEEKKPEKRLQDLEIEGTMQDRAIEMPQGRVAKWEAEDAEQAKRMAVLETERQALQADWSLQIAMNRAQEKELTRLSKEMKKLRVDREKNQGERVKQKERFAALLIQMEMAKGERV